MSQDEGADDSMAYGVVSVARISKRRLSGERPGSSGSEGSRRSALGYAHTHAGMHAHFADGSLAHTSSAGSKRSSGTALSRVNVAALALPLPSEGRATGFVPDEHDAEYDSQQHRDFSARRKAHYGKEFVASTSMRDVLKRGAAAASADEDDDVDMETDSEPTRHVAAGVPALTSHAHGAMRGMGGSFVHAPAPGFGAPPNYAPHGSAYMGSGGGGEYAVPHPSGAFGRMPGAMAGSQRAPAYAPAQDDDAMDL